jgi:hypothetical protein
MLCVDAHKIFVVFTGFVKLVVIVGRVILNESLDPLLEGTSRSRISGNKSVRDRVYIDRRHSPSILRAYLHPGWD